VKINLIGLNNKVEYKVDDKLTQHVIRREACVFACLDFRNIKKNLQKSSLTLQLKQLSPFNQYDSYVIWKNDHVMLWVWQSNPDDGQLNPKQSIKLLPETLFYGKQHQSKVEIVQLDSGYEARLWVAGLIMGSQYWPNMPSIEEWNNFLRNHSKSSQQQLPEINDYCLNETPWYEPHIIDKMLEASKSINLPLLICSVFFTVFCYQIAGLMNLYQNLEDSNNQHEIAMAKANDIVTARNNAVRELTVINQINSLTRWPSQIELLATCNQILRQLNSVLIGWKFDDGELQLVIKTDNSDPTAFISAFESSKLFTSVNLDAQSIKGNLSLHMILRPLHDEQILQLLAGVNH